MKKILLVQPPKPARAIAGEDVFIYEPLALEYLAAGVTPEHDVRILDMRLEPDLQSALIEFAPDVVGITAYTVHVNTAKRLFEQVKSWNPQILTVVGGHHATVMPHDFLIPFIDVIVMGEGIFTFKEIIRRFEAGDSFEGIPGTLFAQGERLIKTECEADLPLDSYPFPVRSLTERYRAQYFSEWMKPLASIRTSKGCPHRCNYCAQWKISGGRYQKREPEQIVRELAEIKEENVFFADDESLIDVSRMKVLADLIKEAGIRKKYFLYCRSDTIARHPELMRQWRDIGLSRAFIGLEFFRDEDMREFRKNSTIEENEKAIRIMQELGIDVYASLIVRPDFTHKDFDELRRYCMRLKLNFATFAVLTPLPGTDLYQEVQGKFVTNNYDYVDFIHTLLPTNLSLEEFYKEFRSLYLTATSKSDQLAMLTRYPLRDIPAAVRRGRRVLHRMKSIPQDY